MAFGIQYKCGGIKILWHIPFDRNRHRLRLFALWHGSLSRRQHLLRLFIINGNDNIRVFFRIISGYRLIT